MNKKMLRLAIMAAAVVAAAACARKDNNSITGANDYTLVALSANVSSLNLHVKLVPRSIDTFSTGTVDTVPAHDVAVDSVEFNPVASIMPQGVPIGNGTANMTFASPIASLNSSSFVQGDTTGTGTFTVTYTDVNHNFTESSLSIPVTVTQVP